MEDYNAKEKEYTEANGSTSKNVENISKKNFTKIMRKLNDDLWSNCNTQMDMLERLRKIIKEKNIKIFLENDNLEIDVPASMPEEEVSKVSKEVVTVDRILNDKIKEYE